jgi:predicted Zn-dependent protease/uncharacterized integral membrane protein
MKRALIVLAGVVSVCAVLYLAWLNPNPVELHLSPSYRLQLPLAAALVLAFLLGILLILGGVIIQGAGRSVRGWWQDRRLRREERVDSLEHQGEALLWEGDSERARALLLRAWRRVPGHHRAALVAARSYLDDGEPAAAERVLRDALERRRGDPDLLLGLSQACDRQGDRVGAIQALEQVRAQYPRATRALVLLRDQYAQGERWAEAVAVQSAYLRTLSRPPLLARERHRLVGLQYEAALAIPAPAERVDALERLVAAHTDFIPAHVSLGDALMDTGRQQDAVEAWLRAVRSTPRTVLLERLLRHASEPRQRQHARHALRKLRPASVRQECVELWQARFHLLEGPATEVLQEIDALPASLHGTASFHQLRAQALRHLGHVDQALSEYAVAAADDATSPYVCRTCGHGMPSWRGRCPQCGSWDSYRAAVEVAAD